MKKSVLQIVLEDAEHYYTREIKKAEADMLLHEAFGRQKEYTLAKKARDYLLERFAWTKEMLREIKREIA